MRGGKQMNYTSEAILLKESSNKGCIYIYYIETVWKVFGQSAYYLHQLYPELDIVEDDNLPAAGIYICIPEKYLRYISEEHEVLAGDDYIQVKIPVTMRYQK